MDSDFRQEADYHPISAGTPDPPSAAIGDPLIGSVFEDKFEIVQLIGEGAMGRVYRARHLQMESDVAVKIMQSGPISNAVDRFKREAVVCATLNHPSIVRVHHAGVSSEGYAYLVMDLVPGRGLDTHIKSGISLSRFFSIFRTVVQGLKFAHSKGIVHRDLKPGNILIYEEHGEERAVIVDFGIAKAIAESAEQNQKLTQTGTIIGTTSYMSPEQCMTRAVDARSDIYSLGCVMYESLTGQPPFDGDSAFDVMYKHLNQSLSELGALSSLPKSLSELILKCLAKAPEDRFQSMDELEAEFEKCAASDRPPAKKSRVTILAAAIASGVLVLAAGMFVATKDHLSPKQKTPIALEENRPLPSPAEVKVPKNIEAFLSLVRKYRRQQGDESAAILLKRWLDEYENDTLVNHSKIADVHYEYAITLQDMADFNAATKYYASAAKLVGAADSRFATYQSALAHLLGAMRRDREAMEAYKVLFADLAVHRDAENELTSSLELAEIYERNGQMKLAKQCLDRAKSILNQPDTGMKNTNFEQRYLTALAIFHFKSAKTQEGISLLKQAKSLSEGLPDPEERAGSLIEVGAACVRFHCAQLAAGIYLEALKLTRRLDRREHASHTAAQQLYLFDKKRAQQVIEELIDHGLQTKDYGMVVRSLAHMSDVAFTTGGQQEAAIYSKRILPYLDKVRDQASLSRGVNACMRARSGRDLIEFIKECKSRVTDPLALGFILCAEGDQMANTGSAARSVEIYKKAAELFAASKADDPALLQKIAEQELRMGHQQDAIAWKSKSIDLARSKHMTADVLGDAYMSLAATYGTCQMYSEAREALDKACATLEFGSPQTLANALRLRSSAYPNDQEKSLYFVRKAKEAARRIDDSHLAEKEMFICDLHEAHILSRTDFKRAMAMLEKTLEKAKKAKDLDPWCVPEAEKTVADVYKMHGDEKMSAMWMLKFIKDIEALHGDPGAISAYMRRTADRYESFGDFPNAEKYFRRAVEVAQVPGAEWQHAESLAHLGHYLAVRGKPDEGEQVLKRALAELKNSGDRPLTAYTYYYLGITHDVQKKYGEAIKAYLQSFEAFSGFQARLPDRENEVLTSALRSAKLGGMKEEEARISKILASLALVGQAKK